MKAVGLRELKNRLSAYVREVRSGDGVLVTDRGEVVAELSPPGRSATDLTLPSGLAALAKRELITLGAPNDAAVYPAVPSLLPENRSAQLLEKERGGR